MVYNCPYIDYCTGTRGCLAVKRTGTVGIIGTKAECSPRPIQCSCAVNSTPALYPAAGLQCTVPPMNHTGLQAASLYARKPACAVPAHCYPAPSEYLREHVYLVRQTTLFKRLARGASRFVAIGAQNDSMHIIILPSRLVR